jgi:hypothetical protein
MEGERAVNRASSDNFGTGENYARLGAPGRDQSAEASQMG